ncbi:MAG: GWxTD domain-containing protein [Ignavibacteriaceae bacterium]
MMFFIACGTNAQNSAAADIPAVSEGEIRFYIDHSSFKGSEDKLIAEFYLMLFADHLDTKNSGGKNIAEFSVHSILYNSYGSEINSQEWTTEASINDSVSAGDVIYDQWNEKISPGDYKLKVVVSDLNSSKKGIVEYAVKVNEISDGFVSSQIEFVSKIEEEGISDHFKKGNKFVVPNPSRRYGLLNPILYVYYELYNLSDTGNLEIYYSVIGKSANTIKSFPSYKLEKSGVSSGVIHGLNVGNIPSGIYNLSIKIKDTADDLTLDLSRHFEIIQKDFAQVEPALSVKDDEIFEWLLNIFGTGHQQKIYSRLNLTAKAEFIVEFWKNLDPSPGTPENEYLENIQQRFVYANKNFKWGGIEGWKTERGRVLIQYGMPDEIKRHYSEAGTVPYEIWEYSEARSFYFVFGDLRSDGRFVLLHSNKEGEISNERWIEYIRRM